MNDIGKCLLGAGIWGGYKGVSMLGSEMLAEQQTVRGAELLLFTNFGLELPVQPVYLIMLSLEMLPFFVFQMLFGIRIYRHYCTASVYFFSRCTYKVRWFVKEAAALYVLAVLYAFTMLSVGCLIFGGARVVRWDIGGAVMFVYELALVSLWLFLTTVTVNLLAIRWESGTGFGAVACMQLGCIALLNIWDRILPLEDVADAERNAALLRINPISHLVLCWHSSSMEAISQYIDQYGIYFDLNESVIVLFLLSLGVCIAGGYMVKNQELILTNREEGR